MSSSKYKLLAYIGLGVMTLIVGLSFIFVKIGLESSNTWDLLAHRFSAAFVAIAVLKLSGVIKTQRKSLRDWMPILGVSLLYPILCFAFQTLGLEHSTASYAGIIYALIPVFTLIGGSIFLKEKTSGLQKVGIAISVLGLIYISLRNTSGEQGQSPWGGILLLLSVLSFVAYYMAGKKIMQRHSSLGLTSAMITFGFIIFNLIAIVRHASNGSLAIFFEPMGKISFVYSVLYLGVLSSVVSSFLSNYALKYISTANVSIFNNISPLISIVGGVVFLRETLYLAQIIGAILVLLGVVMVLGFKPKK